jgi:PAS domain S-box-containing protein
VIHFSADGLVLAANPAATRILGLRESEMTRWPLPTAARAVHEDGTQFRREDLPVQRALTVGEVVSDVLMGVPHGRTGEIRWLLATAVPDTRNAEGLPARAYVLLTDLTEQRQAQAALRESTSLLGRLREANVLGVATATEDGVYEANDAFLELIGRSRDDLAAGPIPYESITPPECAVRDRDAFGQLRRDGSFQPYDKEYLHRDGHRVPVLIGGAVVGWNPLRWVTFVVDLTARQRAERERAELVARERAARAEAAGHSLSSASMMGQVRCMLRAYAIDNPEPGRVLRQANYAAACLLPDTLASVVYAVLDLATGDLAYASAGHPPPILITGDGQLEYFDDTDGIMLGVTADAGFSTGIRRLSHAPRADDVCLLAARLTG